MSDVMARLQKLAEKYDIELEATTPEDAEIELLRRVPALAKQRAAVKRDFVPKGDPRGRADLDPGNESSWDVR